MLARILVVEDHGDSREILRIQFEHLDYEVIEAKNGEEAIEKTLAENPDLIVMDLGLPGIDGIEATVVLKQNPRTSEIPIIAHSAWGEGQYKDKALKAGMAEFLPKPASPAVFREVLQKILHGRQVKAAIKR